MSKSRARIQSATIPEALPARRGLARRRLTPPNIIERLARDDDASVRAAVAQRRELSAALRDRMASDPSEWVRENIARRPGLSMDMLSRLASDSSRWVRAAVAGQGRLALNIRSQLARDPEAVVRAQVARCSRCPRVLVRELIQDGSIEVRSALLSRARLSPRHKLSPTDLLELALSDFAGTHWMLDNAMADTLALHVHDLAKVAARTQVRELLRIPQFNRIGQQLALTMHRQREQ